MDDRSIKFSSSLKNKVYNDFFKFLQSMANRIIVGYFRYGEPDTSQQYMTRLIMEVKAYKRTGNHEHLMNIANYCWLESVRPENSKYHFDSSIESVTRKKIKSAKN